MSVARIRLHVGAFVLGVVADRDVPRILAALRREPLSTSAMKQRLPDVAPSTLEQRVRELRDVGALEREPDRTSLHRTTAFGLDVLELFARSLHWVSRGPGAGSDAPGRLALSAKIHGALADDSGRALLHALAEGAELPAELERRLPHLTRPTIVRLLDRHESIRLIRREQRGGRGRARPARVTAWAREATALIALAARIESRHSLPDARAAAPEDVAAMLRFAAPLVDPSRGLAGTVRLVVERSRGADAVGVILHLGGERVVAVRSVPDVGASVEVVGTVADWCLAIVLGRRRALTIFRRCGRRERLSHYLACPALPAIRQAGGRRRSTRPFLRT